MNLRRKCLLVLALLPLGCEKQVINTIPPGQYIHLETGNTLDVSESGIRFLIGTNSHENSIEVSYKLLHDGRVELGTSDSPRIFEIIEDNWYYLPPHVERRPRNSEQASQVFAPSVE